MTCSPKSLSWIMIPVILGFFLGSILLQAQLASPSDLISVNAEGAAGHVLVVYHPGLSDFQKDVTFALIEGLIEGDWACDIATAHRGAPLDVAGYDALVLGSPTYAWRPASPICNYIANLEGAEGKPTLLLLTAAGKIADAFDVFGAAIEAVGGQVIETLGIFQAAPNEETHGLSDPLKIARRAGTQFALP